MRVKKTQKKKYKKQAGVSKYNHEIIGIIVIAVGILSLLSVYLKSAGVFGTYIAMFIKGLLGLPAFLVPPFVIAYGIFIILRKDDNEFKIKSFYTVTLLILVSALIQSGSYDSKEYINRQLLDSISKFYHDGANLYGGGVLGGLLSLPFLTFFQVPGTVVILTAMAIIDIILLTNVSLASILLKIKSVFAAIFEWLPDFRNREKALVIDLDEKRISKDQKKSTSIFNRPTSKPVEEKVEQVDIDLQSEVKEPISFEPDAIELVMEDVKASGSKKKLKAEKVEIDDMHLNDTEEYNYPPVDLLENSKDDGTALRNIKSAAIEGAKKLEETLKSFGVEARVINVSRGPAVTRYELQPSPGVKVSKIVNLADDISLNLAAAGVRIEAPIPGKAAIGIEVANKEVVPVFLREVVETDDFRDNPSKLAFAVGKDISGRSVVGDIGKMPHLLVAGATGSGKSVCINSIIVSLLFKAKPNEVKLLMIDPKVVELGIYNGIPHLLIPVVTDPRKAAGALNWAVQEMVNRYKLFADKGVRDLKGYNALAVSNGETALPQIVIIIDELADLMMAAPNDVEDAVCRLAQMARAAGMHLVIATQRPSVDVITGVIKANIPSRIAFSVASQVDSRTILDMAGAEKLLGKGDMLFYPIGEPKPVRIKGTFVSDKEVESVVEYVKSKGDAEYNNDIIEEINTESNDEEEQNSGDNDALLPQAISLVVDAGQASVSLVQRKFKVGYARAARIVDQMEARGIVGPFDGSKPRPVLISRQQWNEMQMKNNA
ncbi:MAG TPA: DNA translocase FtsK 4TM domain-containing protein [Clostridia bacterium]